MRRGLLLFSILVASSFAQSYASLGDSLLDQFLREALERNPRIQAAHARYRAALQEIPQVNALPDPMVSITGYPRSSGAMLAISQRIPWFGKLSDQGKIAAKKAAALAALYEAEKAEVVRQVKLAYYALAYLDRAIDITRQDLELLENYETMARARYQQGVGLQQAVVKLQAEITRDLSRLKELQSRRVEAEARLNQLMDRPARAAIPQLVLPPPPKVTIDCARLTGVAQRRRPELLAALFEIEGEEKRVQLARRQYWPDLTLGAGFAANVMGPMDAADPMPPEPSGKNMWSIMASVNLPISRRKYDAGVLQATEQMIAARNQYRDLLNEIEASIRATGFRIETIREQIELFEKTLLPQAEQALRSSEAAYATGLLGVLELLDSERVLLEVRLGLERLRSEYLQALAEMERVIGAPFPEQEQ